MSLGRFGKTTPMQIDMLSLGGVVNEHREDGTTDAGRLQAMREARRELCDWTGVDFGYDLAAWHAFLSHDLETRRYYTHPYAWHRVEPEITRLIQDPDRVRLVKLLEAEGD